MKIKLIILIVSIMSILLLYFGYDKYMRAEYVAHAMTFKEYVLTATELAKSVIGETDRLKTESTILRRTHESTHYNSKEESTNYGCFVLRKIMDNNMQIDDINKYSKVILDSCLREANTCLKWMRKYKDYYPSDHQSLEKAISTLRPIIRHYEKDVFTKEFYLSSVKDIESIINLITETDVNIGEMSLESQNHIKSLWGEILSKSYLSK